MPELKRGIVIGVLAWGLSGNMGANIIPPRSLNQLVIQSKFGEYEIARKIDVRATIGDKIPHTPETFINFLEENTTYPPLTNSIF
jgi:hypothetical protein